ncbi:MAG: B12-binding domain-containing radical SAM protein [Gemmatimonadaceae bacterium]|nr:B12-binding domain-containing radical SAM protein [Gemmatimonadaceae bacterium]
MTPLVFAYLSSMTPAHIERVLYDDRFETIPFDEPTDLVAMTVETYTARRAYQLAAEYRKRGVPVVLGGYHPSFMPEEGLQFADAIAIGDAEGIWSEILDDARVGRLKPIYRQPGLTPLETIAPDRSIYGGKRYAPIPLVQYARGCKYACEFCSISAFYGRNLRQRSVPEVIREIEALDRNHVFIVDDNIFVDEARATEFFEALVPLKIRWSSQISIDVAGNPKLMDLLRRSGCISVVIGFESLDTGNLRQMKKGWNVRHQDYDTSIARFKDAGVMIYGTFVHGYDRDTPDSFKINLEFALRHKFYLANFNALTPMPGTKLYHRLRREGRLLNDPWWLDSTYRYGGAVFRPVGMTPAELEAGCYWARSQFNSARSIVSRAFDLPANMRSPYALGVYLATNLVSRTEIHRKQGSPLGIPGVGLDPRGSVPDQMTDTNGWAITNHAADASPIHG